MASSNGTSPAGERIGAPSVGIIPDARDGACSSDRWVDLSRDLAGVALGRDRPDQHRLAQRRHDRHGLGSEVERDAEDVSVLEVEEAVLAGSAPGILLATGTRGSLTMPHSMVPISEKSLAVQGNSVPSA